MLELLQTFRVSYQTISGDLEFMRGIAVLDVDAMHSNFDTAQANSVHEATKVLGKTATAWRSPTAHALLAT